MEVHRWRGSKAAGLRRCVVEKQPTYKQFVQNMELKMQDPEFLGDTDILLREGTNPFKPQEAYQLVKEQFIDKMPGKRD